MLKHSNQAYPYAEAVFDLAKKRGTLPKWSALLCSMALISADQRVQLLFNHPKITDEQWVAFFIQIMGLLGQDLNKEEHHFVQLLVEYHRLHLLPQIAFLFERIVANYRNILKAQVTSAYVLDETYQQDLRENLKKYFRCDVDLTCQADPNLIGGLVIRVGDFVIDGSVRGRLVRLKKSLIP